MEFLVRPVERVFERVGHPPVRLSCRLTNDGFAFSLRDQVYVVPILRTGVDERGPFAVIEEQEEQVGARLTLYVEPEYHEDLPTGCQISVAQSANRRPYDEAARGAGYRPAEVNLIIPNEAAIAVSFNSLGTYTGCGYDHASHVSEKPSDN